MFDRPTVQLLAEADSDELSRALAQSGYRVSVASDPSRLSADHCVLVRADQFDPEVGNHLAELDIPFLCATVDPSRERAARWVRHGARGVFSLPASARELAVRISAASRRKANVTCLGGGTGLFHLLQGLKVFPNLHLRSIVTVSDDGGSSGRLRSELGVLPPGDVRRSLVALSDAPDLMNALVRHRFQSGAGLEGHSLGNLILSALAQITGSLGAAVRGLGDVMHIRGDVYCASDDAMTLCAEMEDDSVVRGESAIDLGTGRPPELRIRRAWLEPRGRCGLDAYCALLTSDLIVIGPGDLYTSIIANLVVDGIAEAVCASEARVVYVCNLMSKPGETPSYSTSDHVRALVQHLGADRLDVVLASSSTPSPDALEAYAQVGQHQVQGGLEDSTGAELLLADVSDPTELVRHDPERLASSIRALLPELGPGPTADLKQRA